MKDMLEWLTFWLGFWTPTLLVPLALFIWAGFWIRALVRNERYSAVVAAFVVLLSVGVLWLVILWGAVRKAIAGF